MTKYGEGWDGTHEAVALNIVYGGRFYDSYSAQWLLPRVPPLPEHFYAHQGFSTPTLKPEKLVLRQEHELLPAALSGAEIRDSNYQS